MVYLDNINKSGTFLKSKNSFSGDDQISLVGLVEGFAGFLGLIGAMIVFAALCKIIKCEMLGHDSNNANNAAEEFPLQQGIMNGAIPNNRNNDIEIPLIAEEAEAGL